MNRVKIIDFGMCEFVSDPDIGGFSKIAVGPVRWMAPECFVPVKEGFKFSAKSDVWMFGCSIYELVECSLPYGEMKDMEVVQKRANGEKLKPIPESERWDPPLQDLCRKCWDFDPAKRPSMMNLRDAFANWYTSLGRVHSAPERM